MPNVIDDVAPEPVEEEEEEEVEEVVEVVLPPKMEHDEIFEGLKKEVVKLDEDDLQTANFQYEDGTTSDDPPPKKEKKKRKPMSEEHKEKLKVAREKALLVRRQNAKDKKEIKDLEKLKKQKDLQKLKDYVNDEPIEPTKPIDIPPQVKKVIETPREKQLTMKDIEEAQLTAIMKYDALRKSQKKEKKKIQDEERQKEVLRQKINRAVNVPQTSYGNEDYYDNCF